jgi:AmmeMemoRadiSam system protein B
MKKILFFLCFLLENNLALSQAITINAENLQDTKIRKANFAGSFYEQDKEKLNSQISSWIKEPIINEKWAIPLQAGLTAVIVPHAGYEYSGKLAAQTFMFANQSRKFKKIFLIGQPHRVSFPGIIIDKSEQWETPLGNIDLDLEMINMLSSLSYIKKDSFNNLAFSSEHSLEVQAPLIKTIFPEAKIIPI